MSDFTSDFWSLYVAVLTIVSIVACGCGGSIEPATDLGVDAKGSSCAPCPDGKPCVAGTDCASGVCTNGTCRAATCTDGVKNGGEMAVDCGGPCPYPIGGVGCDAHTTVLDLDLHAPPRARAATARHHDVFGTGPAHPQHQATAVGHRVEGVAHQIDDGLVKRVGIGPDGGQIPRILTGEAHAPRVELVRTEIHHALQQRGQPDGGEGQS